MSWSYSPGLVGEFLDQCCSDTEPSAQLNTTHTPDQYYWQDKPTEHSRLSRFGTTCELLTVDRGEELLTWFLAASRARTYQLPEKAQGSTANVAACGVKWNGLLGRYNPDTHSLKTAQLSLLEDLTGCSVTLPRWGLMQSGELFPLPTLARHTEESASGYSAATWATPTTMDKLPPKSPEALLREATIARPGRTWPTATATAYKGWSQNHNRADTDDRLDYAVERMSFAPGQQTPPMRLNPDWCEWLMGWPIGQTALKPLATGRFREFEQQHGGF